MENYQDFKAFLVKSNLSENTVMSYVWTVGHYFSRHQKLTKKELLAFKGYLVEHFSPQTVNLRLQAVNKYLEFIQKENLKLKFVKVQRKNYLENVISDADYRFFKHRLKTDGHEYWYFVVWFLAATGSRVSELLQMKVEHVRAGYFDLYAKGGKIRRLYIPRHLQKEAMAWITHQKLESGYLFLNQAGQRITARGIAYQLKRYAREYGLNVQVVYPHSFRHRYAKNFLEKYNDISLLADLMGHDSIETTRIYLRRTSTEQRDIVNTVVTW